MTTRSGKPSPFRSLARTVVMAYAPVMHSATLVNWCPKLAITIAPAELPWTRGLTTEKTGDYLKMSSPLEIRLSPGIAADQGESTRLQSNGAHPPLPRRTRQGLAVRLGNDISRMPILRRSAPLTTFSWGCAAQSDDPFGIFGRSVPVSEVESNIITCQRLTKPPNPSCRRG